jgi:hypothetical protein
MSVPNIGPELPDQGDPEGPESNRRHNPAAAFRDEVSTGVIETAQARAATVSHRFGGARYALTRPEADADDAGVVGPADDSDRADGGDPGSSGQEPPADGAQPGGAR